MIYRYVYNMERGNLGSARAGPDVRFNHVAKHIRKTQCGSARGDLGEH